MNQNARIGFDKLYLTCVIAYMHFQLSMINAKWSYFNVALYKGYIYDFSPEYMGNRIALLARCVSE